MQFIYCYIYNLMIAINNVKSNCHVLSDVICNYASK